MEVDVYGRVGISRSVDAGIKLFGPFGGIFGDVKWQISRSIPLVSVGLGGSYGHFRDMPDSGDDFDYLGLYPVVLFGSGKVHGGIKMVYIEEVRHHSYGSLGTSTDSSYLLGFLLGACFEDRGTRALPEITIYLQPFEERTESRVLTVAGVAFEFVLSTGEQEPAQD